MSQSRSILAAPAKEQQAMTQPVAPKEPLISYNKDAPGEIMSDVEFPPGVANIILDCMGLQSLSAPDKKSEKISHSKMALTLFGKHTHELISLEASGIGNLILHAEKKDVEQALELIIKNPSLLYFTTIATDPLGRKVQGTPLQIAAMAGDVNNLYGGNVAAKNQGMVERIVALGFLSKEEVAAQLQCIVSDEAKEANHERNRRILDAIKKFGRGVIRTGYQGPVESRASLRRLIAEWERVLQRDGEIITQGYVFDPKIIHDAMKWYEDNVPDFGGWWSREGDIFWTNGIGKLQSKLSSRDAQCVRDGVDYSFRSRATPARTLNNTDGTSHFYNAASRLGSDFYLGYNGVVRQDVFRTGLGPSYSHIQCRRAYGELMLSKNKRITKFAQCQPDPKYTCQII